MTPEIPKDRRITYGEMKKRFKEFNKANDLHYKGSGIRIFGVVVLAAKNFPGQHLSFEERAYRTCSDEKAFLDECIGYSIFAENLAKTDFCRLEDYIEDERGPFEVAYCYMED